VRGALRHCQEGATPLRVLTLTMQAFLLLWAGRTEDAEVVLAAAEDDVRWLGGMRGLAVQTHASRVLLHTLRGEAEAARAAMRRPRELLEAEPDGQRRRMVLTAQQMQEGRLCAWLGDVPRLRELSAQLGCAPAQDVDAATDAQRALLPAYVADAEGRMADAIAFRRAALAKEAWLCRLGMGVETRLRLAAALLGVEGTRAAADVLRPVLRVTDDETEMAPVLFAGPTVLDTLANAPWRGQLDAASQARLRRWAELAHRLRSAQPAETPTPAQGSLGTLSPRETEVLARIAAGDSNKLIARAFDLSPHTVKRHVANILDKLGVQTRGQAAAWYRQRTT